MTQSRKRGAKAIGIPLILLTSTLVLFSCGQTTSPTSAPSASIPHTSALQVISPKMELVLGAGAEGTENLRRQALVGQGIRFTRFVEKRTATIAGRLYTSSTYEFINETGRSLNNLNFIGINQISASVGGTAYKSVKNKAGQTVTDANVVRDILPTNAIMTNATTLTFDQSRSGMQIFTGAEAAEVKSAGVTAGLLAAGDDVLEFGYHAINAGNTQAIPNGGLGMVTFSVSQEVRDDATMPWTYSVLVEAIELPANRTSRAAGEDTGSVVTRARAMQATQLGLMGDDEVSASGLQIIRSEVPKFYTPGSVEKALDLLFTYDEAKVTQVDQEMEAWKAAHPGATKEVENAAAVDIILSHKPAMSAQSDMLGIGPKQKLICLFNVAQCIRTAKYKRMADSASTTAGTGYGNGYYGGRIDAMRHAYWNALMVRGEGSDFAVAFARAHEDDNPNEPALSRQMDSYNNNIGQQVGEAYDRQGFTDADVIDQIRYLIGNGVMRVYNKSKNALVPSNSLSACTEYNCVPGSSN